MNARMVYRPEEVVFGKRFADMTRPLEGRLHIDHRKISDLADL